MRVSWGCGVKLGLVLSGLAAGNDLPLHPFLFCLNKRHRFQPRPELVCDGVQ